MDNNGNYNIKADEAKENNPSSLSGHGDGSLGH